MMRFTVPHNAMNDDATPDQRTELERAVIGLLRE